MDVSRILIAICGFALSVCLFFSIGALSSLRRAIAQGHAAQEEAEDLIDRLDDRLEELESIPTDIEPLPNEEEEKKHFMVATVNRMIGVYNSQGELLRIVDVSIDTLPKAERERLQEGISASSWQEVEALLQDYDA